MSAACVSSARLVKLEIVCVSDLVLCAVTDYLPYSRELFERTHNMIRAQVIFLTALIALCGLTNARTYIKCDCSYSKRGFQKATLDLLIKDLREIVDKADEYKSKGLTKTQIEQDEDAMAAERFRSCVDNNSYEECVNADAAIRRGECYPNCRSFCAFYEPTWESINQDGARAPACDTDPKFRSTQPEIVAGKPETPSAIRPTPSPSRKPVAAPGAENSENKEKENSTENQESGNSEVITNGTLPEPSGQPDASSDPGSSPGPVNEGCVAIEHLQGYTLQHVNHLQRSVLCAHGFCATPNHAIIVEGEWTSMKHLCANKWDCVKSVKMVNNLKAIANSRAVFNDLITITPYDLRFPRWGVWLVQFAEDIYELVGATALITSVSAALIAMVAAVTSKRL